MVSAAEQLAANLNFSAFRTATELKQRIWFTLAILLVYRLGTYVPLPGINPDALNTIFQQQQSGIIGIFNMFAGGAIGRMAIFALNIMPYITASIIVQLMAAVVPSLEQLKKEGGEQGRMQINQYARYGTVLLAMAQGYGLAVGLESAAGVVVDPGWAFRATAVITLTGGTIMLLWLGEQITVRGIGNGVSLIIFAGIVAELPSALAGTLELGRQGVLSGFIILGLIIMVALVIAFIVYVERAQRRLLVQYPKRQMGNRLFQGDSSHLPLKLNTAGVIPPIFASSLLLLPVTFVNFAGADASDFMLGVSSLMGRGQPLYLGLYAAGIIFFCFFYTSIVFNPSDTAENLKKSGGFVPGIRPGERTAEYIDYVLTRLTFVGSLYLTLVCLLPEVLISRYSVPFYFGGTGLLIVVNVTMDTVGQVQSHLFAHQYEGLLRRSNMGKGLRGSPSRGSHKGSLRGMRR